MPIDQVSRAWIVDVHLIRGIRRGSPAAHDPHQAIEVKRSGLACGPRYVGDRADRVRNRVIDKGVRSIGEHAAGDNGCHHP